MLVVIAAWQASAEWHAHVHGWTHVGLCMAPSRGKITRVVLTDPRVFTTELDGP